MSDTTQSPAPGISFFEKWLTAWVTGCIIVGILLGKAFPGAFAALSGMEVASVNIPVAVLIWLMIVPMLMKIDFAAMLQVGRHWRGIGVPLLANWAIKPFSMVIFGWLTLGWLFRPLLPEAQAALRWVGAPQAHRTRPRQA